MEEIKKEDVCWPPNFGMIMMEVIKSLPVWVMELPSESYVAEVSSRIVLHPETQKFARGDQHVLDVVQSEFESILLRKIRETNRYKQTLPDAYPKEDM